MLKAVTGLLSGSPPTDKASNSKYWKQSQPCVKHTFVSVLYRDVLLVHRYGFAV